MANEEIWEVINKGFNVPIDLQPEDIWNKGVAYFEWSKSTPIELETTLKSGKGAGNSMTQKKSRAMSMEKFCLHSGISMEYLVDIKNSKDKDSLYYHVVNKIWMVIYTQNLELAMINEFSVPMTMKLLNMGEEDPGASKTIRIEHVVGLPKLAKSENEVLEKLDYGEDYLDITKEQNTKEQSPNPEI